MLENVATFFHLVAISITHSIVRIEFIPRSMYDNRGNCICAMIMFCVSFHVFSGSAFHSLQLEN